MANEKTESSLEEIIRAIVREELDAREAEMLPLSGLSFGDALSGMRRKKKYRCLEWGKKRLYEQKYMYLVNDEEERKFHFYITDPCTGKVDTWLPTEVEILGLWEEVEW